MYAVASYCKKQVRHVVRIPYVPGQPTSRTIFVGNDGSEYTRVETWRRCKRVGDRVGWCYQHHPDCQCRTPRPRERPTMVTTPDDGTWNYWYCRRCRRFVRREFVSWMGTDEALGELLGGG